MAISADNFSIEGVKNILAQGNTALNSLNAANNQQNLSNSIQKLQTKIKYLEDQEQILLSRFTAPNSREDIRRKILQYNNKNFSNFFGENLREKFIQTFQEAIKANKTDKDRDQNLLAQALVQEIYNTASYEIKEGETIATAIGRTFNEITKIEGILTDSGRIQLTKNVNMVNINETTKLPEIIIEKLTPAMRRHLDVYLQELKNNNNSISKTFSQLKDSKLTFNPKGDNLNIVFQSEWANLTQLKTGKEIKELVDNNPQLYGPIIKETNYKIIQEICNNMSQNPDPLVRSELERFLIQKTHEDPYLFFIGKTAQGVTGILGEIAAVQAIFELTGKIVPIDWVANNLSNGKKVSIDIVLDYTLGINVKNTSQKFSQDEGFHQVEFVNRGSKDILEKLIGQDYAEDLSNAFDTSYFNISYQIDSKKRPHVIEGPNPDFDGLENQLKEFKKKLEYYLYQFAPELLYMATPDLRKTLLVLDQQLDQYIGGAGNILYLVGGVPFFPSEMLRDLVDNLQVIYNNLIGQASSNRHLFFFNIGASSSDGNIIKFLNNRAAQGMSVELSKGDLYSLKKYSTVQLTSSWTF